MKASPPHPMPRPFRIDRIVLGACLAVAIQTIAHGHNFAFGLSTIEHNERTGSLEIIHRLFLHDLEPALVTLTGRAIDAGSPGSFEAVLRQYVEDRFAMRIDGGPTGAHWLGAEVDGDIVWIYQELPNPPAIASLSITNELLHDVRPEQLNQVNVKIGRTHLTLEFTQNSGWKSVDIER